MPSRTLAFFWFFNRKLDNIWWILQGHTYIVSENKRKQSNSQKGWRYRPLNRKMFIKLSKPQPLCTKVKNSEKWSFNNFPWFPTLHTNIVLWYMIVWPIWVAEKCLISIIVGKIAYFTGLGGGHWKFFYLYSRPSNLHPYARDMLFHHRYVACSYLHRFYYWNCAVLDRDP